MAVGVVIPLEVVYIKHDEGYRVAPLLGLRDGSLGQVHEVAVVIYLREAVEGSLLLRLLVEARILEGHCSLGGQRTQQALIMLCEGKWPRALHRNHPYYAVVGK